MAGASLLRRGCTALLVFLADAQALDLTVQTFRSEEGAHDRAAVWRGVGKSEPRDRLGMQVHRLHGAVGDLHHRHGDGAVASRLRDLVPRGCRVDTLRALSQRNCDQHAVRLFQQDITFAVLCVA